MPDPQNGPAKLSKQSRHPPISQFIPRELRQPVTLSALGLAPMARTSMPETAVNENGKAFAPKNKVGPSWQRLMTTPACNAAYPENGSELQLCVFVASRTNGRHNQRSLLLSKHIGHGKMLHGCRAREKSQQIPSRKTAAWCS